MKISRRNLFTLRRWSAIPSPADAFADPQSIHFLNRISFGARPEDVARLASIGMEAYLDEQLSPATIDDSALDEQFKDLAILKMNRRALYALQNSEWRIFQTMVHAFMRRAIFSKRQLLERLTEFWTDHFNINADTSDYNADLLRLHNAIRRNALGNFQTLLQETAKSPAMLIYLDNFVNEKDHPNENYARELMELHTLGVNGGYTEQDVKEVARAFTGWTIHNETRDGFYFDPYMHDTGEKTVLGHTLPAGRGIEDGLHVLGIVAHHPATAQFICRKLAVRFVSDNPPDSLVDALADIWQQTGGEIKPVLRHLFLSAEFAAAVGQKFRRPLDFLAAAIRATGTTIHDQWVWEQMLQSLGQIPFGWHPPDGYPDVAAAWTTTDGLLARWNTAMQLTHGAQSDAELGYGMHTDLFARIGSPATVSALVDVVSEQVFGAPLLPSAAEIFVDFASDGQGGSQAVTPHLLARKLGSLFGLMLASPLFQWH